MHLLFLLLSAAIGVTAMADDARYWLRLEPTPDAGRVTIAPLLVGPAHKMVRYEMVSTKSGGAGKSTTKQSGKANLGPEGKATLSTLRLSVGPTDRYAITVTVLDGKTVVAEASLNYPP